MVGLVIYAYKNNAGNASGRKIDIIKISQLTVFKFKIHAVLISSYALEQ